MFFLVLSGDCILRYDCPISKQGLFAKAWMNCMKLEMVYVPKISRSHTPDCHFYCLIDKSPGWFSAPDQPTMMSWGTPPEREKDVWHIDEWIIIFHSINYSFINILSRDNFKSRKEDKSGHLHALQRYASSWLWYVPKFRRIDIWRSCVAYHSSKYIHTNILYSDMQK